MTAATAPTAKPAPGPNAKPHTMAGMSEGSYVRNGAAGRMGICTNENSAAMAHISAMVTSWRVDQRFVFLIAPAVVTCDMVKPLFCEARPGGDALCFAEKSKPV